MKLFKRKSKKETLQGKYEALMKEWHQLSSTNRAASDAKYAEAQLIVEEIEKL